MKICSKCKVEKDESEFSKDKKRRDGLNLYCRKCNSDTGKIYRLNNIDVLRKKSKEFRLNNIDKRREINKKYKLKNAEKIIEQNKEYRSNNRELINERNKKYRLNNYDSYQESLKKYVENNREKVKESSKKYILKLTDKYVKHLIVRTIPRDQITPELIEWKRISIRIKRLIKEKKQCEISTN